MDNLMITVKKDEVICREGDLSRELYKIISGKLMICSRNNSMVTPLAHLETGEYFGEFSFFDGMKRSADVVAIEESTLIKVPLAELKKQFPRWLLLTAQSMTNRLRVMDNMIRTKGIKKKSSSIPPLSIDEQRHYYNLILAD